MFGTPRRPLCVAFDIIGTVFPLEPLRAQLSALGLPQTGLETWFATGLRDAFALAAAEGFKPFSEVLEGALDTVLAEQRLDPSPHDRRAVIASMEHLPPRDDAQAAFTRLAAAGVPAIAVSNGSKALTGKLLKKGGLASSVAHVVSTEQVKRSKPAKKIYLRTAKVAGVPPNAVALIAAHPWDINGAKAAGLVAGYVAAPGLPYPVVMHKADVEGTGLVEVVDALLALQTG